MEAKSAIGTSLRKQFLSMNDFEHLVITEGLINNQVIYYMAFLIENKDKMILPFMVRKVNIIIDSMSYHDTSPCFTFFKAYVQFFTVKLNLMNYSYSHNVVFILVWSSYTSHLQGSECYLHQLLN